VKHEGNREDGIRTGPGAAPLRPSSFFIPPKRQETVSSTPGHDYSWSVVLFFTTADVFSCPEDKNGRTPPQLTGFLKVKCAAAVWLQYSKVDAELMHVIRRLSC
jgi:hypothetical protein